LFLYLHAQPTERCAWHGPEIKGGSAWVDTVAPASDVGGGDNFLVVVEIQRKKDKILHMDQRDTRAHWGAHVCEPFVIAFDTLKREGAMVVGGWNYVRQVQ
jgi:hypothetical protein